LPSYLLDTDVISELMAPPTHRRRQKIVAWLRSLGDAPVILSSVSIAEINRGIALLNRQAAATAIRRALDQTLAIYGDAVITPSHADWQTYARLSAVPELRLLCHGKNRRNLPRTGADIFLAIQATDLNLAVATCNGDDFVLIDRHLPLVGGIVDPSTGAWVRKPTGTA